MNCPRRLRSLRLLKDLIRRISSRFMGSKWVGRRYAYLSAVCLIVVSGCSPLRLLDDEAVFVAEQEIEWPDAQKSAVDESVFDSGMRISSNSKFLGIRVPMLLHGMVRPEALERSIKRRTESDKPVGGLRWWLSQKVGEVPASLDLYKVERTALNIQAICKQMGYLDAECFAVIDTMKQRTVCIRYALSPGSLWTIADIEWLDLGSALGQTTFEINTGLEAGQAFSVEELENARNSMAQDFRDRGFASIQASHINFLADTLSLNGSHEVHMLIQLSPEGWADDQTPRAHKQARFGNVSWSIDGIDSDSLLRASVVDFLMAIEPGMRYNEGVLQQTQRRLTELPCVSRVDIPGSLNGLKNEELVYDVNVLIHPAKRFGMTTALDMTRTDARYGPILSWSLMDRLATRRGDEWDIHLSGGLTSTRPFTYSSDYLVPNSATWSVEAHYSTLGIPPFSLGNLRPSNHARSEFAFTWARENRPEYAQNSLIFKWGFHFVENPARRSEIRIDLFEFRRLKVESEVGFQQWLEEQSNPFLTARFQDYASILSRVDWRTNWSLLNRLRGAFTIQAEWTGWGLEAIGKRRNWNANDSGQLLLGSIPFAHYFRSEAAWTWELKGLRFSGFSWHGRLRGGWSVNGANFNGIPFDRSFFAGGANGLRGWSARDVGPVFADPDDFNSGFISGLGDVQGELSVEARKSLNDVLEMAVFSDLGNVWLQGSGAVDANPERTFNLKSLAWGAGLGMRLDLDFFVFRVDAAVRIHDPSKPQSQRWISEGKPNGAVHLGIGYPF
mgnify:CR=1 FL=1